MCKKLSKNQKNLFGPSGIEKSTGISLLQLPKNNVANGQKNHSMFQIRYSSPTLKTTKKNQPHQLKNRTNYLFTPQTKRQNTNFWFFKTSIKIFIFMNFQSRLKPKQNKKNDEIVIRKKQQCVQKIDSEDKQSNEGVFSVNYKS